MATVQETLELTKGWAIQTLIFAKKERYSDGPLETLEQTQMHVEALVDRMCQEVMDDCGLNPQAGDLINGLAVKVLNWVAENWKAT